MHRYTFAADMARAIALVTAINVPVAASIFDSSKDDLSSHAISNSRGFYFLRQPSRTSAASPVAHSIIRAALVSVSSIVLRRSRFPLFCRLYCKLELFRSDMRPLPSIASNGPRSSAGLHATKCPAWENTDSNKLRT